MSEKIVTIGLRVDSHFVRMLNANVQLSDLRSKDVLEPMRQLALIALMEMRGATEEEIHVATLHDWRGHIEIVPEMRKVEDAAAQQEEKQG